MDVLNQSPFQIDQHMACKMKCLILLPFEAPRRPRIASGASKMTPRRLKDSLQALQDAPKAPPGRLQDGPWYPQDGPNCAQLLQRAPRSPPGLDCGPSRPRFSTLQTSFFNPPDLYFDPFEYRSWRGGWDATLMRVGFTIVDDYQSLFNIIHH